MKIVKNSHKSSKKRGMYTSPVVQGRVRLKRAKGYTKSEIARTEGISFDTVKKILNDEHANQEMQKTVLAMKGNAMVALLEIWRAIQSGDTKAAWDYLEAVGLLSRKSNAEVGGDYLRESERHMKIIDVTPKAERAEGNGHKKIHPFLLQAAEHFEKMTEDFNLPDLQETEK